MSKLVSFLLQPLLWFFGLFSTRRGFIFEVLIVGIVAATVAWYIYSKFGIPDYKIKVNKVITMENLGQSFEDSRYIGPKKGKSQVIKSLEDAKKTEP